MARQGHPGAARCLASPMLHPAHGEHAANVFMVRSHARLFSGRCSSIRDVYTFDPRCARQQCGIVPCFVHIAATCGRQRAWRNTAQLGTARLPGTSASTDCGVPSETSNIPCHKFSNLESNRDSIRMKLSRYIHIYTHTRMRMHTHMH